MELRYKSMGAYQRERGKIKMIFFLSVLVYLLLVSIFVYKRHLVYQTRCKNDSFFLILSMGVLLLLTCLRGMKVGNDTKSYAHMFNYVARLESISTMSIEHINWLNGIEKGYQLIEKAIFWITGNYQIFISIVAIISYTVLVKFLKMYSPNLAISVILFYLVFWGNYINLLRQVLALSIVLLAIPMLNKRHVVKFVALILIASFFHKTAFAALGYLLLLYVEPTKSKKIAVLCGAVVLGYGGKITGLLSFLKIETSYSTISAGTSIYMDIAKNLLLLGIIVFMNNNIDRGDDELGDGNAKMSVANKIELTDTRVKEWIPVICLAISFLSLGIPALSRLDLYYSIMLLIIIPDYFQKKWYIETNKGIVLFVSILMLLTFTAGTIIYRPEWVTEYNYYFFWND